MRLDSIRLRNIGALKDVDLNLADLGDARVIAVVGENGAGKSTLLEVAAVGSLYRTTPTRGSLVGLATGRDSLVEVQVTNGKSYRIRHVLDAVSGKSEASACDIEGRPFFDSSKVTDFSAWAAKALPAAEVTLATVFAAQQSSGFLGAKASERKSILLRALGIEALEDLAKRARGHSRDACSCFEVLVARIADEKARAGDRAALELDLAHARRATKQADVEVVAANEALSLARLLVAEHEAAELEFRRVTEHLAKLKDETVSGQSRLEDLDRRVDNNRAILRDGDSIRAAVEALELRTRQLRDAKAAHERQQADLRALQDRQAALAAQLREARARVSAISKRLEGSDLLALTAARLPLIEASLADATEAAKTAEAELEVLRGQRIAGADERIDGLRLGLHVIAKNLVPNDAPKSAHYTLEADDAAVAKAVELPAAIAAAWQGVTEIRAARNKLEVEFSKAKEDAARFEAVAQLQVDFEAAAAERIRLDLEVEALSAAIAEAESFDEASAAGLVVIESVVAKLEPLAKKLAPLEQAETRLAELEPQRAELAARLESLRRELSTPAPTRPLRAPELSDFESRAKSAEDFARAAHARVAVVEVALQNAVESAARVQGLEAELAGAQTELSDWNRLADDLGPNGLQLTLIDSAGPEITDAANELLRECHGTRFSVRVETQRLSSDKKKLIDGCDVIVTDTENGREAAGETFSGGERVIIGEALSLALTVVSCRRAGVREVTLVRDETAGQLSPENARAYLGMLRRASDMVGASRVLFVAHDPALWEMADARLEVSGGRVVVS